MVLDQDSLTIYITFSPVNDQLPSMCWLGQQSGIFLLDLFKDEDWNNLIQKKGSPPVFKQEQISGFNPVSLEIRPENWIVNVHWMPK